MTDKCPACDSSRYEQGEKGWRCKRCGYVNDPNYLNRGENESND